MPLVSVRMDEKNYAFALYSKRGDPKSATNVSQGRRGVDVRAPGLDQMGAKMAAGEKV